MHILFQQKQEKHLLLTYAEILLSKRENFRKMNKAIGTTYVKGCRVEGKGQIASFVFISYDFTHYNKQNSSAFEI